MIEILTGKGVGVKAVVVTLDSPMPCGSGCYEVIALSIVVENQTVRDIRTLHRVEKVSGQWIVTRTTVQGSGIIG